MSLANVISQFRLNDLTQLNNKKQSSLKDWLKTGRFIISIPIDEDSFELIAYKPIRQSSPWAISSIASDINRFASASFESIDTHGVEQTFDKSMSWQLIRHYYAAFFAAHALLRIYGQSISMLERSELCEIEKIAAMYGMRPLDPSDPTKSINLKKGMYQISFIDHGTYHTLKGKHLSSSSGGSHELMWGCFEKLLADIQLDLLSGRASGVSTDLLSASDSIKNIRNAITSSGSNGGNWLSKMRNRINYNHHFDVWYPFGQPDAYYQNLSSTCKFDWNKKIPISGLTPPSDSIKGFVETCGKIVGLCKDSIELIDASSSVKVSFLNRYAMSYLSMTQSKH